MRQILPRMQEKRRTEIWRPEPDLPRFRVKISFVVAETAAKRPVASEAGPGLYRRCR